LSFDVVIKDGKVIDGTGNPWFKAYVGIEDGIVTDVGNLRSAAAELTINASGLVVCPGFIDVHTHSDFTWLLNPKADSFLRQGVTTEVIGNCGFSVAPVRDAKKELMVKTIFGYKPGLVEIDWHTLGEYLNRLEKTGLANNVAPLVGHGTIRIAVMGYDNRLATKEELQEMKILTHQSMKDGALGISYGGYAPCSYADTNELIELCKVVAAYGGIFATHVRRTDPIEAYKEAIEIGEKAGVPVQILHLAATGYKDVPSEKVLELVESARKKDVDVTCDIHGYLWGVAPLSYLIPYWVHEGGVKKMLERLRDLNVREKIKKEIKEVKPIDSITYIMRNSQWDKIKLHRSEKSKGLVGKTFAEIANLQNLDPVDAMFEFLLTEGEDLNNVYILIENYRQEDVNNVFKHNTSMIGSDGLVLAPYGDLSMIKWHPRSYGTFPRIFRRYVREEKLLTIEEAIRKMTSFPAQRIKLKNRGLIKEGMIADIVVFDPEEIEDRATYEEEAQYPVGIEYILVNGTLALDKGEFTGKLAGKPLRLREFI